MQVEAHVGHHVAGCIGSGFNLDTGIDGAFNLTHDPSCATDQFVLTFHSPQDNMEKVHKGIPLLQGTADY